MNHRFDAFRTLFQRLLVASVIPVAGCGATVVTVEGDAAADASTPDAPTPDARSCARVVGTNNTCTQDVTYPCSDAPRLDGNAPDCAAICRGLGAGMAGGDTCSERTGAGAGQTFQCIFCAVGRRVEAFAPQPAEGGDAVGAYLAAVAQLEAASVAAFARLAHELSAHGAPAGLVAEARRAAHDERRHARDTARLARARGARVPRLPRLSTAPRDLRAMAVDNAAEGCVRETFGALVATWQAAHAAAPDIARVMDGIALEETRHAALSWSVAAWLDGVLDDEGRAAVHTARATAAAGLLDELSAPVDPRLVRDAGMPDASAAVALARGLLAELPAA